MGQVTIGQRIPDLVAAVKKPPSEESRRGDTPLTMKGLCPL